MKPPVENVPVVEMRNISKHFAAVRALQNVNLVLHKNEVLGLVGDNAAGKSTLMKILSGAYIPDGGEILIAGKQVNLSNPMDARRMGIEMVYQDYALATTGCSCQRFLDVKLYFNSRTDRRNGLSPNGTETQLLLNRLKSTSFGSPESRETFGRAAPRRHSSGNGIHAKVTIMDEPTAALSVAAIDKVLDLVRELKAQGSSIIVISHRLEDIYQVSDRMMVLRHGHKVCDCQVEGDINEFREKVVAYIIGARDDYSDRVLN
jgi:ABC-type sugar transport system ATPase subunit